MRSIFLIPIFLVSCSQGTVKNEINTEIDQVDIKNITNSSNPSRVSRSYDLNGTWKNNTGAKYLYALMTISIIEKHVSEYEVETHTPEEANTSHLVALMHMDFYPKRHDKTCKMTEEKFFKLEGKKVKDIAYLSFIAQQDGINRMVISIRIKQKSMNEIVVNYQELDLTKYEQSKAGDFVFKRSEI